MVAMLFCTWYAIFWNPQIVILLAVRPGKRFLLNWKCKADTQHSTSGLMLQAFIHRVGVSSTRRSLSEVPLCEVLVGTISICELCFIPCLPFQLAALEAQSLGYGRVTSVLYLYTLAVQFFWMGLQNASAPTRQSKRKASFRPRGLSPQVPAQEHERKARFRFLCFDPVVFTALNSYVAFAEGRLGGLYPCQAVMWGKVGAFA